MKYTLEVLVSVVSEVGHLTFEAITGGLWGFGIFCLIALGGAWLLHWLFLLSLLASGLIAIAVDLFVFAAFSFWVCVSESPDLAE